MRAPAYAVALLVVSAVGSAYAPARALDGRGAALGEVVKAAPLPADAIKRLKSGDPAQIQSALDDVRIAGRSGAPAVPAIVELLGRGASIAMTRAAIETLGDIGAEAASGALSSYARHRNVALRRAAVLALTRTRGAAAIKALRLALTDPDPGVRGLSATGLGTLKAKEAIGELFVALDHGVAEASASIGQLCASSECDTLAAKLGTLPFGVVTAGLDPALFRPMTEVSEDTKMKIVARVRELGTGEANHFLHQVQRKWRKDGSQRVRQAIDQAVLATSGSPGAAP